ncbi:MAG: Uma2 family endonuclease [Acidobacteria bacterium]|nr:Uma2 family endonuclease [Acidobacteriota bacterium]
MALPMEMFTESEYAALEAKANYRSEFINGQISAMAGGISTHAALCLAVGSAIRAKLKNRCMAYGSDLRIRVRATALQTYPDVSVVCGPCQYWGKHTDCVENPVVLVEVLSRGTAAYDRGAKFAHYKLIESLREYVLVWQSRRGSMSTAAATAASGTRT